MTRTTVMSVDNNAPDPNTGNAASGSPYKAYVALFTQEGEADPTVQPMNAGDSNYLGEIVWTRHGTGNYWGALAGSFPENKTFYSIGPSNTNGVEVSFAVDNIDRMALGVTYNNMTADNWLYLTPIEIRVYQ